MKTYKKDKNKSKKSRTAKIAEVPTPKNVTKSEVDRNDGHFFGQKWYPQ